MGSNLSPKCLNGTVLTQCPLDLMEAGLPFLTRNRLSGGESQRSLEFGVLAEEGCDTELAFRCNMIQSDLLGCLCWIKPQLADTCEGFIQVKEL